MLKCQLHTHARGDLLDKIPHSPKELIRKAAELSYDVLAITCHKKVIFDKKLKNYAKNKGILLIPGVEIEINKKHIVILNATKKTEDIENFSDLEDYKQSHPNCLIVAPHPFFPGKISLKKALIENIALFDAIEYSFCYTKTKNYNKPAMTAGKLLKKPLIAASDCHILKNFDLACTYVDAPKNTPAIIQAIKANKLHRVHRPISTFKIGKMLSQQMLRNVFK